MIKRRKVWLLVCSTFLGFILINTAVRAYQVGKTMSIREAEKRWGTILFTPDEFKSGGPAKRAQMVVDLIQKKVFIGKSTANVFEALGRSDGHFFSDAIPAYLLNEGWKTKTDTWQVVFLLDRKSEMVSELIIQKNCCDSK